MDRWGVFAISYRMVDCTLSVPDSEVHRHSCPEFTVYTLLTSYCWEIGRVAMCA